ncbi:MAG: NADH-quinone oxidoreductase subunit N [candidate division Zixibacteria bacterium]|jgi:NADH-quinone oxidoreductase subunit N|nr:NADH-quinone oxidoreductase subunit N [candidate division Zixibacteria bacterium]
MVDYVSAVNPDFGMVAPELTLLIAASLIMLFIGWRRMPMLAPAITLLGIVVAFGYAVGQWGNQVSGFAGMVTCDNFGVIFKLIFLTAAGLSVLLVGQYLKSRGIDKPEYYALIAISTVGMMAMANTTDLVVMFIGLEVMSVPLYVMAGFNRRSLESNEAGIKYFIMGAFATAFLLMGIAFVYGAAGTTNLRQVVTDFNYIAAGRGLYLYAGVALILIGFGFKVGAVPFHSWIPDVYHGAPTPVTAFFSVAPKAAAVAVLLRIFLYGFADVGLVSQAFWVLSVLTMTLGNILALRQDNVKRMLAYSSIAHAGYILVALTVGTDEAISSAIFYVIAYTFFNLGAFTIVALLETRMGAESEFSELSGLAKSAPVLSLLLAVFMFALSGFPPTVGFFGKFYIFRAAIEANFISLAVIGVLNSFVSVYYYLRVVKTCYFDDAEHAPQAVFVPATVGLVLFVTTVGTLGFGLFPQQLLQFTRQAIFAFL